MIKYGEVCCSSVPGLLQCVTEGACNELYGLQGWILNMGVCLRVCLELG